MVKIFEDMKQAKNLIDSSEMLSEDSARQI